MNGMLEVQDYSNADLDQVNEASEASTMEQDLSFSEVEPQQKFKSRHFPEPFWGIDD